MRALKMTLLLAVASCSASGIDEQASQADPLSLTIPLSPLTTIVFRPGDPAGSRFNVYTTWNGAYDAISRVRELGQVYLEFDTRFAPEAHVPAGNWLMNDVIWTDTHKDGIETRVVLDDGASIQVTNPGNTLQVVGDSLSIVSDRIGPVAPFHGVSLLLSGVKVFLYNTRPDAKPAFVVDAPNLRFIGFKSVPLGGVGTGPALPAPFIEIPAGGTFVAVGFSGHVNDNTFTGPGTLVMRLLSPNFNGGLTAAENYNFPAFTGTVQTVIGQRDRSKVSPVVTTATYAAQFNELVRVDSMAGTVTVTAPKAQAVSGDKFMVKDVGGHADLHPIAVVNAAGEMLEGGSIKAPGQTKTWISDGSKWLHVGTN